MARSAAVQEVEASLLQTGKLVEGRPCATCQGDYPTFLDVEPAICVACLTESSGLPFRAPEAETTNVEA
jgi:hypothetical protein